LDLLTSLTQHWFAPAALASPRRSPRHRTSRSGLPKVINLEPSFRCGRPDVRV